MLSHIKLWDTPKILCSHKIIRLIYFLFFESFGTTNYSSISNLLDKTKMNLFLLLTTYVAGSQKLSKDLVKVLQMLDHCQLPVWHMPNRQWCAINLFWKPHWYFKINHIHEQGFFLTKGLSKYFSNNR